MRSESGDTESLPVAPIALASVTLPSYSNPDQHCLAATWRRVHCLQQSALPVSNRPLAVNRALSLVPFRTPLVCLRLSQYNGNLKSLSALGEIDFLAFQHGAKRVRASVGSCRRTRLMARRKKL